MSENDKDQVDESTNSVEKNDFDTDRVDGVAKGGYYVNHLF